MWSGVAVLTEVPSGALADRWSRRGALVAAGVLQALGYVLWLAAPGFAGFAVGFALWGFGGSLSSGAFEALLYDGLRATGAEDHYARVKGRAGAASFLVQLPVSVTATILFVRGGYPLVGWVSVGLCLLGSAVALLLTDVRVNDGDDEDEPGYLATLHAGLREVARAPAVRLAVIASAVTFGLDAFEEYVPLLAADWGVGRAAVPLALVAMSLVGAAGSALGGRWAGAPGGVLGLAFGLGAALLVAAAAWGHALGLIAVTLFYGLQQLLIVVTDTRLQDRISGPARATVTSVATLGGELTAIAVLGVWAAGRLPGFAALAVGVALLLPRWLRVRRPSA